MSPRGQAKRPHGQIRQSQLITTFGPGAMLDLPNYSVLISGLDYWSPWGDTIAEPRLAAKLCTLLSVPSIDLRLPPADPGDPTAPSTGVNAWQFPEWFITQDVHVGADQSQVRSRLQITRTPRHGGRAFTLGNSRNGSLPRM